MRHTQAHGPRAMPAGPGGSQGRGRGKGRERAVSRRRGARLGRQRPGRGRKSRKIGRWSERSRLVSIPCGTSCGLPSALGTLLIKILRAFLPARTPPPYHGAVPLLDTPAGVPARRSRLWVGERRSLPTSRSARGLPPGAAVNAERLSRQRRSDVSGFALAAWSVPSRR